MLPSQIKNFSKGDYYIWNGSHGNRYVYIHRSPLGSYGIFNDKNIRNQGLNMRRRFEKNFIETIDGKEIQELLKASSASGQRSILNKISKELYNQLTSQTVDINGSEMTLSSATESLLAAQKKAYDAIKSECSDKQKINLIFESISDVSKLFSQTDKELIEGIINPGKISNQKIKSYSSEVVNTTKEFLDKIILGVKKGDDVETLESHIKGYYATTLGESIIKLFKLKMMTNGISTAHNAVLDALNRTGGTTYTTKGDINNIHKLYGNKQKVFKSDDIVDNELFLNLKEQDFSINISTGFNIKTYNRLYSKEINTINISEKSFSHRLEQIISGDKGKNIKYYAYNALGHYYDEPEGYEKLKQYILSRNLDIILAGTGLYSKTGAKDFSQFLLINGKLYPNSVIINNFLKNISASQSDKNAAISLTINGVTKVASLTTAGQQEPVNSLARAYSRSKKQNIIANSLGVTFRLHVDRLNQLVK